MAIEAEPDEDIVSDRHGRNIGSENREREREREKAKYNYCLKTFHGQYRKIATTS